MAVNKVNKLTSLKRPDAIVQQRNNATVQQTGPKREYKDQRTTVYLNAEVVRWFKQNTVDTGESMSNQIERLARAEMDKQK
jgi:hypothetical protein